MLQQLPEWAKLVRLSNDEMDLIGYYRSCPEDVRYTVGEFCRLSAERCIAACGAKVISLPARIVVSRKVSSQ